MKQPAGFIGSIGRTVVVVVDVFGTEVEVVELAGGRQGAGTHPQRQKRDSNQDRWA